VTLDQRAVEVLRIVIEEHVKSGEPVSSRRTARLHAEQLSNVGGTQVATRHGALSCDHLEYANDADAAALARAGTVAVMLPIAFYALAEKAMSSQ